MGDFEVCDIGTMKRLEHLEMINGKLKTIAIRYNELLMAVSDKFVSESRHDLALKYIKQVAQVVKDNPQDVPVEEMFGDLRE